MNYNFDEVISREKSGSVKGDYTLCKKTYKNMPKDFVPMWVADMDFKTAPSVTKELNERLNHPLFGYLDLEDSFFEKVIWWQKTRNNLDMKKEDFLAFPGVVSALAVAIRACTKKGDGIIIQQPVYNPFDSVTTENKREVVVNELIEKDCFYTMDFEDLEEKAKDDKNKLMIICNPHNPVGRAWSKEELSKVLEICYKNNIILVSDEIHSDLIISDKKHISAGTIDEKYDEILIILTSMSKTFNLASLGLGYVIVKDKVLNAKLAMERDLFHWSPNVFSVSALKGAYTEEGAKWTDDLCEYLKNNFLFLKEYVEKNFSKAKIGVTEASYLAWIDIREYKICHKELFEELTKSGALINCGSVYGEKGKGFLRINFALPKSRLEKGLNIINDVLHSIK